MIRIRVVHVFISCSASGLSRFWKKNSLEHNILTGFVGIDSLVKSKDAGIKFETVKEAVEFIGRNYPQVKQDNDDPDIFRYEFKTETLSLKIYY